MVISLLEKDYRKNEIQSLQIFPVKSARGLHLEKMSILSEGPQFDREWMLVDENGQFLSQRTVPKLAQLETALDQTHLTLAFQSKFIKVSLKTNPKPTRAVQVWERELEASDEARLYSDMISEFLNVKCTLVRWNKINTDKARFSDRSPIQLLNLKSLDDLNSRLKVPAYTEQFRANIVFQGETAFEEEKWEKIKIGEVVFSNPEKCSRCKIITLDFKTGQSLGPEVLNELSQYRRVGSKINFGVLWTPENEGVISKSDTIEVLS